MRSVLTDDVVGALRGLTAAGRPAEVAASGFGGLWPNDADYFRTYRPDRSASVVLPGYLGD